MKNILVIRFSSLGDIVLTEPVVRLLKSTFAESRISYLTKSSYASLLRMFSSVDRCFYWSGDSRSGEVLRTLREQRFDLVIDLHNNPRSAWVRLGLGVKAVKARREWLKRIAAVKFNSLGTKPSHAVDRYLAALRQLNIEASSQPPELQLPKTQLSWWESKLTDLGFDGGYFVIAAGAAHTTKKAPTDLWVELVRRIEAVWGYKAVVVGSPAERGYLQSLAQELHPAPLTVVAEEEISRATAALRSSRFVISNDSGVAHLAAAVGTPVLALFGPTHPVLGFAPLGSHADHYTVNEYCSPCSLHGDRKCYRDSRYCFTKMSPDDIVTRLARLIRR